MLAILIHFILITCLCNLSGLIFFSLFNSDSPARYTHNFTVTTFTGLILLTIYAQLINFIIPINTNALLLYTLLLVTLLFIRKKQISAIIEFYYNSLKEAGPVIITGSILIALICLKMSSGPTIMDDTESYHIQIINWNKLYTITPGIANLHTRYGFQSSWFAIQALLNPFPRQLNFYSTLNCSVAIWLSVYLLRIAGGANLKNPKIQLAAGITILYLLFNWTLLRGSSTNTNYDFITVALLLVVFFETTKQQSDTKTELPAYLILWGSFLFTIRFTNLVFIIAGIALLYHLYKAYQRKAVILLLLIITLVGSTIIRHYISSGYPLYPAKQLAITTPDWKVPEQRVDSLLNYIKYYNRISSEFNEIEKTSRLSMTEWVPVWARHMAKIDLALIFCSLLAIIPITISAVRTGSLSKSTIFLSLCCFANTILWFAIAPDPRFNHGSLLIMSLIPVLITSWPSGNALNKIATFQLPIITTIYFLVVSIKLYNTNSYNQFIFPTKIPEPPVKEYQLGNGIIRIPDKILQNWNPRCYAIQPPCIYKIEKGLEFRGSAINQGFRINKKD